MHAREAALKASRRVCERERVQLLDETVRLRRLGLSRHTNGWLRVRRTYAFEYSVEGDDRRSGEVVCLGRNAELVWAEWPNLDRLEEISKRTPNARVIPFRGKDGTSSH